MPSLSIVRAANLAAVPKYRPTALFLGGTSGIGQAVAEALASTTSGNAHIILCGRNKSSADQILQSLHTSSASQYEFEPCDAMLMSNVRQTTGSLLGRLPKLNYLVLSPGYLTLKGRDETSEGIDKKLALHYYARWRFVYDLLPLLEKAKAQGEEARVLTVLSAGTNGKIDEVDLDLKTGYGLKAAADSATAMNDYMCESFAARHPDMSFVHTYPGLVRTLGVTNFHWTMKLLLPITRPFSVSPADCAQWMLYTLLDPQFSKGAFFSSCCQVAVSNIIDTEVHTIHEHTGRVYAATSEGQVGEDEDCEGEGQAVAEALASTTNGNAHIILCGRNKSAADQILQSLHTSSTSQYEFEPCDAILMSNVHQTTAPLLGRLAKLNYLVLSPGFLTFRGRDETSEGIDKKLALNYYARWRFVYDLLPLLERAKAQGEEARVLTVLGAGMNGKIDEADLDLKTGYGLKAAADSATAMNDYMCESFAAQHPDIAFIHADPGVVLTPMATNFHWSMKLLHPIIRLFSVSPADCAQ
ncbi:hypothetical protein FRC10_004764 [Ceratobasidium sp. 414]|nr:hypothetical protein FRC10_004764 [Ceratobasidium sp. 414]